jgi:hypothetical protein
VRRESLQFATGFHLIRIAAWGHAPGDVVGL